MDAADIALAQLHASIEADLAERGILHQEKIARLKAAGTDPLTGPLVMLAHGDSWFDYPLSGNWPAPRTDVIVQLEAKGKIHPIIRDIAHHGEATTDAMSVPKQQRMIRELKDPRNWMGQGKPDAILFSAGGNDICGEQFCIYLDYAPNKSGGVNADRLNGLLASIRASYCDLFAFRDHYAKDVPIFAHCYDFAIPNGIPAALCVGPWLRPSLKFCGWNPDVDGRRIVDAVINAFHDMLATLAGKDNNFYLIDTRNTLSIDDWANEVHPFPDGYKKVADKFVSALHCHFPDRI